MRLFLWMVLKLLKVLVLATGILTLLLIAACSPFVWLPDLFTGERVVDSVNIGRGETVSLVQEFVGDGYLTRLRHQRSAGTAYFVCDGDGPKAWFCALKHRPSDGDVVFNYEGKDFYYCYRVAQLFSYRK